MNKTNLLAALCMIAMLILPQAGLAKMVALSDSDLSEVIGQAGFAEDTTTTFNSHIDNMTTQYGLLNLSDVTMQGSVVNRAPAATITNTAMTNLAVPGFVPGFAMPGLGLMGLGSMGLGTHLIDMTINIDKYTIGAIRVGNDTTGPSLGDFAMYGFKADIKGTVSITAH
jgi:hypothetical protein